MATQEPSQLRVRCRAQYLTSQVEEMRDEDYRATFLVNCVKGKNPGTGYARVKIDGERVKIEHSNKDVAIEWFAEWAAPLVDSLGSQTKVLVPIPSHEATGKSKATFRTVKIARAIAKQSSQRTLVFPYLRWIVAKPNTRNGGSRDPVLLYRNLEVVRNVPDGDCVLVDDVMTSGGHLKAAAWYLEDKGKKTLGAVCCGRTLQQQLDDPFSINREHLGLKRPTNLRQRRRRRPSQ